MRILVAEDDEMLAGFIADRLRLEGWQVDTVADGVAVCDTLSVKYDAIVLDLMMPKMDGFGVLVEIQKRGIRVPVIVATNMSDSAQLQRAKDLGATDAIVKSDIDLDSLPTRITAVIESYAGRT